MLSEHILHDVAAKLRAGRAADALQAATAALATDPMNARLNALASAAAFATERYDDAVRLAQTALGIHGPHGPTFMLLGRGLRALGRFVQAAAAFEAAVQLDPDAPDAPFLLCATLLHQGDPRAAGMLAKLLDRFPQAGHGWEEIGIVLAESGKQDAALACFRRAMQSAASCGLALRMGFILRALGRLAEAAAAFRQAADLDPSSTRARFMLGVCQQDQGNRPAAVSSYRAALKLDPTLAEAAVNLGTVLQDSGDLDGAKSAYSQALASRPDSFGRIAQAMTNSRRGELWLDLDALRRSLAG